MPRNRDFINPHDMTHPQALKLCLPCLVLALTFCAGNPNPREEHRSALVPHEAPEARAMNRRVQFTVAK